MAANLSLFNLRNLLYLIISVATFFIGWLSRNRRDAKETGNQKALITQMQSDISKIQENIEKITDKISDKTDVFNSGVGDLKVRLTAVETTLKNILERLSLLEKCKEARGIN